MSVLRYITDDTWLFCFCYCRQNTSPFQTATSCIVRHVANRNTQKLACQCLSTCFYCSLRTPSSATSHSCAYNMTTEKALQTLWFPKGPARVGIGYRYGGGGGYIYAYLYVIHTKKSSWGSIADTSATTWPNVDCGIAQQYFFATVVTLSFHSCNKKFRVQKKMLVFQFWKLFWNCVSLKSLKSESACADTEVTISMWQSIFRVCRVSGSILRHRAFWIGK
jgi:hypothetical protein